MPCSSPWSVSADWIVPGDGRAIRNGVLRGCGERIVAVGNEGEVPRETNHRHFGSAAILPGLVNVHAHLELSHLRGKLPRNVSMAKWLMALLLHRGSTADMLAGVELGAQESLAAGTTSIIDISHDNSAWRVLQKFPLRKLCLAEVFGRGLAQRGAMARLEQTLRGLPDPDDRLRFGITPHAPYSTSLAIYRQAAELARQRGWPLCTHLAETADEGEFLRGEGTLAAWARTLGLLADDEIAENCSPVEFARRAGLLDAAPARPPVILAHVNYVADEELAALAAAGVTVAYCPRSSDFFGRSGHRYAHMLRRGINVALGTDSLASNDSLDLLAEMRRVKRDGQVDDVTILQMATLNGAAAMGWRDRLGSLEPGKFADFIAVSLPGASADPLDAILREPCPVVETVIGGQKA